MVQKVAKLLKIYRDDDPILRNKCRPVGIPTEPWVLQLCEDMKLTMFMAQGVGLAANQVGWDYRIIYIKCNDFSGVMINPVIKERSDDTISFEEGCLSLPGQFIDVKSRNAEITVGYYGMSGKYHEIVAKDKLSVIIQHEVDHLDGILMIDYEEKEDE